MTDVDPFATEEAENHRATFRGRATARFREAYADGLRLDSFEEVAEVFREEARLYYRPGEPREEAVEYVETLLDAARLALDRTDVEPLDPERFLDVVEGDHPEERPGEEFVAAVEEVTDGE